MKVCNICLGQPEYTTTAKAENSQGTTEYLFSTTWKDSTADLCKECLQFFQQGRWDKIAERAHDVLLLRLGVPSDGPK